VEVPLPKYYLQPCLPVLQGERRNCYLHIDPSLWVRVLAEMEEFEIL
jgi:hypothetical protein